jgi:hypothetical protein
MGSLRFKISVPPGVYSNGLLTILREEHAQSILAGWDHLIGGRTLAIAITGFGDAFYWEPGRRIFVLPERAKRHDQRD